MAFRIVTDDASIYQRGPAGLCIPPGIEGRVWIPRRFARRRWLILSVLIISLAAIVLDNTILNVALKTISEPRSGLGASQSQLEWAINSYTLVFAGLLFSFGVIGDRIGRRRMLIIGMALFGLSSLISSYAQTPDQLVWARAAMGLGGAAVMPQTLSIITNVFDPKERARAIGIWASAVGVAIAVGPIVGGLLLDHFWWGSVFLVNVPLTAIGIAAIVGRRAGVQEPEPRPDRPPGRAAVDRRPGAGRVRDHRRRRQRLLADAARPRADRGGPRRAHGLRLARGQNRASRRWTCGCSGTAAVHRGGGDRAGLLRAVRRRYFFTSFYVQNVRGYSPLHAGLLTIPLAAGQLLCAPRSAPHWSAGSAPRRW